MPALRAGCAGGQEAAVSEEEPGAEDEITEQRQTLPCPGRIVCGATQLFLPTSSPKAAQETVEAQGMGVCLPSLCCFLAPCGCHSLGTCEGNALRFLCYVDVGHSPFCISAWCPGEGSETWTCAPPDSHDHTPLSMGPAPGTPWGIGLTREPPCLFPPIPTGDVDTSGPLCHLEGPLLCPPASPPLMVPSPCDL